MEDTKGNNVNCANSSSDLAAEVIDFGDFGANSSPVPPLPMNISTATEISPETIRLIRSLSYEDEVGDTLQVCYTYPRMARNKVSVV